MKMGLAKLGRIAIDGSRMKANTSMPMAGKGKGKGKGFEYGYNVHAAVDEDSQIIVGCSLHENPCDSGAVKELLS